jgi:hypothetical protein
MEASAYRNLATLKRERKSMTEGLPTGGQAPAMHVSTRFQVRPVYQGMASQAAEKLLEHVMLSEAKHPRICEIKEIRRSFVVLPSGTPQDDGSGALSRSLLKPR